MAVNNQSLANISAERIKLSIYELNSLAAHPICSAKCAEYLSQHQYENALVCASSDPAIALAIINFRRQQTIETSEFNTLLKQLSRKELTKLLLTTDVYNDSAEILSLSESLIRRNGIRAFATKLIAEKIDIAEKEDVFKSAIFADVGLFALCQLFTKSMLMMTQEAAERKTSLLNLEQEHLGVTDNILSKMLLQKWQLGDLAADTAWLFKTNAQALIGKMPHGKIISIVSLADMLCENPQPDDLQNFAGRLSLTDSINEIKDEVEVFATQIDTILGFDTENPAQAKSEIIKNIYLNQLTSPNAEDEFGIFAGQLCKNINSNSRLIDIAAVSAKTLAKIFEAENTCVFASANLPKTILTAVIKNGGEVKQSLLESPDDIDSENFQTWLYKQIGIEKSEKVRFLPLKSGKNTIGGIILTASNFDIKQLEEICEFLAKLISIIVKKESQEAILQSAIDCLGPLTNVRGSEPLALPAVKYEKDALSEMIAEIAAGEAHELNNPLAVISGRAQLLFQSETDETKKTVLNQISEKAKDIHEIVGQLMNYARPPKPQIRTVSPFIMINNALEKVNARYLSEPLEIKLDNIETLGDVEVDGEQIAEALAEIIYNALESYESGNGPVVISGQEGADSIEIKISDSGSGMSQETIGKTFIPFFSEKSAGRQRGIGLSLAQSYLKNNGCTIKIDSVIDKGTSVTVTLPKEGI